MFLLFLAFWVSWAIIPAMLIADCWLLSDDCWSLITEFWLLVAEWLLLIAEWWLLVDDIADCLLLSAECWVLNWNTSQYNNYHSLTLTDGLRRSKMIRDDPRWSKMNQYNARLSKRQQEAPRRFRRRASSNCSLWGRLQDRALWKGRAGKSHGTSEEEEEDNHHHHCHQTRVSKGHRTCDMWHMSGDTWLVTRDTC